MTSSTKLTTVSRWAVGLLFAVPESLELCRRLFVSTANLYSFLRDLIASTMFGRIVVSRHFKTRSALILNPSAPASSSKVETNWSLVISLRSNFAHALPFGLVLLIFRMAPDGSEASLSYSSNASKGLVVITPPKSKSIALIID